MRRPRYLLVLAGLFAILILWLLRVWGHGLAMLIWTGPVVWLPALVVLLVGGLLIRRRDRGRPIGTLALLRMGERPDRTALAVPVLAFVLFFAGLVLRRPLTERAIANATTYERIGGLPAGGTVRLVPREVAQQTAASAFNSPTETLTDFRIVDSAKGLQWTALRTPEGAVRVFTKKSKGLITLDAERTARSLQQIDATFRVAPGLQVTDNVRWKLLKRHFLVTLQEPVGVQTPAGPRIMVPYLTYKGVLIRRPVLGGVFVVAPDGRIEDLSPAQARKRPELVATGRIFPDTLARRLHDAYAYHRGIANAWFTHTEQTQISDTESNRQPYLIDFRETLGPQWVTVAEPYGRAFAASAVFLTDATTGRTRIWRVPQRTSLSGNRRALQAVRAVSIPGVDFGDGTPGSGNFQVVEPRPVFVRGRVVYLTSIIPNTANAVSKTVIVDAETNKLVAIFDNDRDPQADAKTLRYLETGELPGQPSPGTPSQPGGETDGGAKQGDRSVEQRLDDAIRRQRALLRELEQLRDQVRGSR